MQSSIRCIAASFRCFNLNAVPICKQFIQCSHAKIGPELLASAAQQSINKEVHLLRKYKRKIQLILRSDDMHEMLGKIQITNLISSEDGRNITVLWTIPEDEYFDESSLSITAAQQVDRLLSQTVKSIRQRIARENAFKKVPALTFVHASKQLTNTVATDVISDPVITKPNNVYGLPWDVYMRKVKIAVSGMKQNEFQVMEEDEPAKQNRSETAKWARMWREQNSARMIARRERKHSHQLLGFHQLQKEMDAIDSRNRNHDEDFDS